MIRTTILAAMLAVTVAGPALAYGEKSTAGLSHTFDVGREIFQPLLPGTRLAARPAVPGREQMPTVLTGWLHDGTDSVTNGRSAYPVLTQTALDHPSSSLALGTMPTSQFPDGAPAARFAGWNDLAFDG